MRGHMMSEPLLTTSIIKHAATWHAEQEVVSRVPGGDLHRYNYGTAYRRIQQLAHALTTLGIEPGERVGTLAWNHYRHFELYYAISGIGAVTHTINPRLYAEQVRYIIEHAEDQLLFVDPCFLPLIEPLATQLSSVRAIILLCDAQQMPTTEWPHVYCYETLIGALPDRFDWPRLHEDQACALCYTSGTTGNPKGVMYSHRSTVLHAMASALPDGLNLSADSCVMPVVPMYHVCAWGAPYSVPLTGGKLVLPGDGMDGAALYQLIASEHTDLLLGVPTVWLRLLDYMDDIGKKLDQVKTVGVGGAASPKALIERFDRDHDVYLLPIWGMTETSPLATIGAATQQTLALSEADRHTRQTRAGRPLFGVDMDIFDANNQPLPHDGKAYGNLRVRGPWILSAYYQNPKPENFIDGWFETGDVATIDADGYMQVVDRKKDVIKSGGEWISSIDMENAVMGMSGVAEACVVGVPHPKWDERPLLFIVAHESANLDTAQVLAFLADKVAKWWLPDAVFFVDELPHTATGKLQKMTLREQYQGYFSGQAPTGT